ncbi:hypothetical protein ACQKFO_21320 [Rossellomorea sp. NPDC071047]|uniref:hypothetical protein n=1 Tax=Rossellomorea sp. NPDC071047 TaxID=3390675 RepID=UPI003D090875
MDKFLHWFWLSGLHYILYGIVIIASLMATKHIIALPLKEKVNEWQYRSRLRIMRTENETRSLQSNKPLFKHIYLLIKSTTTSKSDSDVLSFYVITVLLFSFTYISSFIRFSDLVGAAVIAILIALIPYLFLNLRLRMIRNKVSDEILSIVQGITQQYSANSYDIYHALVELQGDIQSKELRKVFFKLISELQVSRNEEQLREVIEIFTYSSNTSWAKRLGSIILKAYLTNENVLNALLTLSRQIEETQEMLEEEKSNSMDSVANGFITVPIFIGSLFLGYYSSGAQSWFDLQFGNTHTLLLLIASFIGVIFSVFISLVLRKPKNDL